MFKNIVARIKAVMYKMGLIKGLKKITEHKDIQISEDYYKLIERWKAQYRGYDPEYMDITYQTIAGQKQRRMETMNMPKVIATEMATLVFNEKCDISISDETFNENIKNVLEANSFNNEFQRYLEYAFALGGMVAKPYFDNGIKIRFVTADCFVPNRWDADDIREGVFITETNKGKYLYTLLEWHEWEGELYVIRNELYRRVVADSKDDLGIKVPLETLYPKLDEEVSINGLKVPLFVYFKPNTANNIDLMSPLGIPLYANSLSMIKALDIAYDSFVREFRLGKKRIIVPASAIKSVIDPTTGAFHRYFDPTEEIYEAMQFGDMDSSTNQIQDIKIELRVEEHINAINALLGHLAMQIGFSAGAFTFDAAGLKTATEVISENSKTFRTKQSHEILVEAGLKQLIEAIGQIAVLYKVFPKPDKYEVTCSFDDSIAEDMTAITNREMMLVGAGLQDKISAIMRIYKITEEEAKQKLARIKEQQREEREESADLIGLK